MVVAVGMDTGKGTLDYRGMDMEQVGMDLNLEVGIEDEGSVRMDKDFGTDVKVKTHNYP